MGGSAGRHEGRAGRRSHERPIARVMSSATEWVPLIEAARIVARHITGSPHDQFPRTVAVEAWGVLSQALRDGRIRSRGLHPDRGFRPGTDVFTDLAPSEWQTLEPQVTENGLKPRGSARKGRVDWITDIVVEADALRSLLITTHAAQPNAKSPWAAVRTSTVSPPRSIAPEPKSGATERAEERHREIRAAARAVRSEAGLSVAALTLPATMDETAYHNEIRGKLSWGSTSRTALKPSRTVIIAALKARE